MEVAGKPTGRAPAVVVVGVKLDSRSRELLTWALVKASFPGDQVIALHIPTEGTMSLLSLANALDALLSVYEGFCNLKQVDLKLKVCKGGPARKILLREALSHPSATLVVGVSKTRRRSSVAEHCAARLPKGYAVFAVDGGRVAFEREAVDGNDGALLVLKNPIESKRRQCRHRIRKSCSKCRTQVPEADWCVTCETSSVLPPNELEFHHCVTKSCSNCSIVEDDLQAIEVEEIRSAIADLVPSDPTEPQNPRCLRPGWSLLRRLVLPKRRRHERSVIHPDQKQIVSDHHCSELDGESKPIDRSSERFVKALKNLNEKHAATCRLFTFQELSHATSNFSSDNLVGRGGSSCVYRGCFPDGNELAVKIMKPFEDVMSEFVQEIEIIAALKHKNIVSLFGFCFEDDNLLLVYNLLSRGSLEENLHGHKNDKKKIGWEERYNVALGIAEALEYLHYGCAEPVIHRDVKSSNILLSDDFKPQLSDFGLASRASATSHAVCTDVAGTFGYLAPEYLMHGKVSKKIDVYAFGVVLLELISGKKPIDNAHESLVMWAKPILRSGDISQLLDPIPVNDEFDSEKIEGMVLAATLCISQSPASRPSITTVFKLLQCDEEVTRLAKHQANASEDRDEDVEGEKLHANLRSHLSLALQDISDDSLSFTGSEGSISVDEYLRGPWSRSSSFD